MAELIDLISMQDIHPKDGLNEIKFSLLNQNFISGESPLLKNEGKIIKKST